MLSLNPFSKWFWSLFKPLSVDTLAPGAAAAPSTGGLSLIPLGIELGSKLFGSIFGGGGSPKVPPEAQFARSVLAQFAAGNPKFVNPLEGRSGIFGKAGQSFDRQQGQISGAAEGLFPEEDILEQAFGSIRARVNRQKEGATARAASLGIKPGSGLAENLRSGIQRGEAEAFGKTRSAVSIAKSNARRNALFALLGLPSIPQGIDVPNVLAQGGQDFAQFLRFKELGLDK